MKYTFFRDELGTIWFRDCIDVEADSYEEALQKMISIVDNDEDCDIDYSEPIFETWNPTSVDDNDDYATIEITDCETDKVLWKNGK